MPYTPASQKEADTRPRPGAAQRPPGELLAQAAQLAEQAQLVVEKAVIAERAKGTSWEAIGEILGGVSKSAAQKRWGPVVARWRESAEIDARKLPAYVPDDLAEFSAAYDDLNGAWKEATAIVARQPLLADLNNATAALSGSPGIIGSRHLYVPMHSDEAASCSYASADIRSLWEVARSFREERDRDEFLTARESHTVSRKEVLEKILEDVGDRPLSSLDPDAIALGAEATRRVLDIMRRCEAESADGRSEGTTPTSQRFLTAGNEDRYDYAKLARCFNSMKARGQAESQRQVLSLEERVTRLERALEGFMAEEPEVP